MNSKSRIVLFCGALALIIAVFSFAGCDFVEDLFHPGHDSAGGGGAPSPPAPPPPPPGGPVVSTLAGSGTAGYADSTGTAAQFSFPFGITIDGSNLYVTEYQGNRIRKIVISSRQVTPLAGSGTAGYADGAGTAARFNGPIDITTDGGNLYVTDAANNRIRKIAP